MRIRWKIEEKFDENSLEALKVLEVLKVLVALDPVKIRWKFDKTRWKHWKRWKFDENR